MKNILILLAILAIFLVVNFTENSQIKFYSEEEEIFLSELRFSVSHLAHSAEDLFGSLTLEKLSALTPEERKKLQDLAIRAKALKNELDKAKNKIDLGPVAVDY